MTCFDGSLFSYKRALLNELARALQLDDSRYANKPAIIDAIKRELTEKADSLWNDFQFSSVYRDNVWLPQPPQDKRCSASPVSSLTSLSSVEFSFTERIEALLVEATTGELELLLQRTCLRLGRTIEGISNHMCSDTPTADTVACVHTARQTASFNVLPAIQQARKFTKIYEDSDIVIPETPPFDPYDQSVHGDAIDEMELDGDSTKIGESTVDAIKGQSPDSVRSRVGSADASFNRLDVHLFNLSEENVNSQRPDAYGTCNDDEIEDEIFYSESQPLEGRLLYDYRSHAHGDDCTHTRSPHDVDFSESVCRYSSVVATRGDSPSEGPEQKSMQRDFDLATTISDESSDPTVELAYPQAMERYMEDFIRIHREYFRLLSSTAEGDLDSWESLVVVASQYLIAVANRDCHDRLELLAVMVELLRSMVST